MNAILLHSKLPQVSATYLAINRVVRTKIQIKLYVKILQLVTHFVDLAAEMYQS